MSHLHRRAGASSTRVASITAPGLLLAAFAAGAVHPPAPPARADLYACEGCEAVREVDPCTLSGRAVIAADDEPGERLRLTGTVFESDGQTPAADVVLYLHQTHAGGLYEGGAGSGLARRHGRLRGWVRTGEDGRYAFDTIVPGIYPDREGPAHVHLVVEENGSPPYYIDDVVFVGAERVTPDYIARQPRRGGNGVVLLAGRDGGDRTARRDIVLERHPPKGGESARRWRCAASPAASAKAERVGVLLQHGTDRSGTLGSAAAELPPGSAAWPGYSLAVAASSAPARTGASKLRSSR